MIYILRLIKGYVYFCASGGFSERFINLCTIHGINLWNVKNDGVKVFAFTTLKEFESINIPAEKSGMEIEIIKKRGAKPFIIKHKHRCGVALGLGLVAFFMWFMSGFIWEVEILETDGVNVEAFTESLAELGVKTGARKSKIDVLEIQQQLLSRHSELLWVSLNIFGTKAQVEMSGVVAQKEIFDQSAPANIVARKNGTVTLVKGYYGVNAVKEGDTVTEGSLLISGIGQNADGSEHFLHAKGEVYAETQNSDEVYCPEVFRAEVTQNAKSSYGIKLFSLKIPLGKSPSGENEGYSETLLQGNGVYLPIGIYRKDNFQKTETNISLSSRQSSFFALADSVASKRTEYENARFLSVDFIFTPYADGVEIRREITCIENIALEQPFTQDFVVEKTE